MTDSTPVGDEQISREAQALLEHWKFDLPGKVPAARTSKWARLKAAWIVLGERIGLVTSGVLLTVVYVVMVGVAALTALIMRADLLRRKPPGPGTFWRAKPSGATTLETAKRQF